MARKIAKGNCHKKSAAKKTAKQFIVAASTRYSFQWLSGKHTHIYAHSTALRHTHRALHSLAHLCTFIVAYFCAPPKHFLSFCQRTAAFAAFFPHTHLHTVELGVCVWVPCCARCPFVWGIRIKNYAVLVASNAKQVNQREREREMSPHSVGFVLYFVSTKWDYFVYSTLLIGTGP